MTLTCNPCATTYLIFLVLCASLGLQVFNTFLAHKGNHITHKFNKRLFKYNTTRTTTPGGLDSDGIKRSRRHLERERKRAERLAVKNSTPDHISGDKGE